MNTIEIDPGLSVCAQITVPDIQTVVALGFRSVICNRPDHEEHGQPTYAEISAEAKKHGLKIRYLPIDPRGLTPEDIELGLQVFGELPGPILAYCRSGARSSGWRNACMAQ